MMKKFRFNRLASLKRSWGPLKTRFGLVLTPVVMAAVALSFGYGLGRGFKNRAHEVTSDLTTTANAASAEPKGELTNIFVQISRKMLPSVVNIYTLAYVKNPWGMPMGGQDDIWRRFFEEFFGGDGGGYTPGGPGRRMPRNQDSVPQAKSLGSGFIIETSNSGGLILTNNHVVQGADKIQVKFTESADEKDSDAEIIGRDAELDVALLRVKTRRKLQAAALSDSDKLEVGEWIAALGNPFGHGHSVSHGILSAKERALPGSYAKYLQVDAPINPGNSGGPLVNLNGDVVGINNAIDARGPGIGFAIPINLVKAILPQLKSKGSVERGYIGVSVDELSGDLARSLKVDENLRAPIITNVAPGQPADKAGLQAYDIITEINGKTIHDATEMIAAITSVPVGETAKLKILRGGREKEVAVQVAKRPDFAAQRERDSSQRPNRLLQAQIGLELEDLDPEIARQLGVTDLTRGIVVTGVYAGSPAHSAGIGRGDVILEVDRKSVKSVTEFFAAVKTKKTYLLRLRKIDDSGREIFAVVTLKLAE